MAGRVLLAGATGTIGRATCGALAARGYDVIAIVRPGGTPPEGASASIEVDFNAPPATILATLARADIAFVVSCLASRTGTPRDAVAIDRDAQMALLNAALAGKARHFVLVSAICVQRPLLAFQHAKLAFEAALIDAPITHTIVRPTAYFKSLSGQVARILSGKPFLMFGDGTLTACKPISDADLAAYVVDCLSDPARQNAVLPIGGPGPAITPQDQAAYLFKAMGKQERIKHVPLALMDAIVGGLSLAGRVSQRAADRAEFARIGRYYATQSMLVWDPTAERYSADLTPETGTDTLFDYYEKLISGAVTAERGDHAVF